MPPPDRGRGQAGIGLLALLRSDQLAPEAAILDGLQQLDDPTMGIGLVPDRGPATTAGPLTREHLLRITRMLAHEPSGRGQIEGWIATSRRGPGCELVAARPWRPPSRVWLGWAAAIYVLTSLLVLRRLQKIVAHDQVLNWSLGSKLAGLFGLGIAFPLGVAGMLAWLAVQEHRDALLATSRARAAARLEDLDTGIEDHWREWELRLGRLIAGPASSPPTIAEVTARLESWAEAGEIDDYYLTDRDGRLIREVALEDGIYGPTVRWARLPVPERERQFRLMQAHGRRAAAQDWRRVHDSRPFAERLPDLRRRRPRRHLLALLERMTQAAVADFDRRHGMPATASDRTGLVLAGLFESELSEFARLGRVGAGQLRQISGALGDGLVYLGVMPGPTGRGECLLMAVIDHPTAAASYLATRIDGRQDADGPVLAALPEPWTLDPAFPDRERTLVWVPVRERRRHDSEPLTFMRIETADGAYDVVARSGQRIKGYTLIAATPWSAIDRAWSATANRAAGLLAMAVGFCLIATWFSLQRLLPPIRQLESGVRAMTDRAFGLRLAPPGTHEMDRLVAAFNRAMRHLADMQLAAVVQATILPSKPLTASAFRLAARYQMIQATGGDFIDYFRLPDGRVGLALGDVTGHGLPAALVTAMAREAIRDLLPRHPDHPDVVLRELNLILRDLLDRSLGMTCVLGVLDPELGRLSLVNAGQTYPVVWHPDTGARLLPLPPGLPLGLSRSAPPPPEVLQLGPSSAGCPVTPATGPAVAPVAIVFYTDGLIEAIDANRQQFGFERFTQAVGAALAGQTDATTCPTLPMSATNPASFDTDPAAPVAGPVPPGGTAGPTCAAFSASSPAEPASVPLAAIFGAVRRHTGPVPFNDDASVLLLTHATVHRRATPPERGAE